ncbi:MAG: exostosin domain-containing protein [Actinomycetota bacterium]
MSIVLDPGGPRSQLLIAQAYAEEGLPCPDIDEQHQPIRLLYPRSFVEAVDEMPAEKVHDLCFVGGLYRSETFANRRWILDYARRHFTDRSYLLITDGGGHHERLGSYDATGIEPDVFIPKETPQADRAFFHRHYFQVLRSSEFTLCPAGDLPWSMRFFEAILCRSIPIVSDPLHVGRNELERAVGFRFLVVGEEPVYDEAAAEDNYRSFLQHHTLIHAGRNGPRSR